MTSRFVTTRSGIEIGRAYVAPPVSPSTEELIVQQALLTPLRRGIARTVLTLMGSSPTPLHDDKHRIEDTL